MKAIMKVKNGKRFNSDKWLTEHFEGLVNKFPGKFLVIADGKIYSNGSPGRLRDKARKENPRASILGLKVPRPKDFICALGAR
ncbi:MAG: hypothetical protein HYZ86_03715 [Candidatus Omnitrophica bacterium]|nr:hypothetical protein [Candidatus Omnitrophota bacterium]